MPWFRKKKPQTLEQQFGSYAARHPRQSGNFLANLITIVFGVIYILFVILAICVSIGIPITIIYIIIHFAAKYW